EIVVRRLTLRETHEQTNETLTRRSHKHLSSHTYLTRDAAQHDITRYIELWYNHKRLHSAVGYRPPREVHAEYTELQIAA
ncbi:hypothetical protein ABZ504_56205, partial [Streptomyces mirabilis]